ncbi:hypothetical protein D3C86_1597150 [compost metagenome]
MFIQVSTWNKHVAGLLKATVLSLHNQRLCHSGFQAFPEPFEAGWVTCLLGKEAVCTTDNLPKLNVAEHREKTLRVSGQFCCRNINEHLIPGLFMLVPSKNHGLSI